jgi:HKD family nuclease
VETLKVDKWVWEKGYIKKIVMSMNITQITVISAYFSNYGLDLIKGLKEKNNLQKDKITVYVSKEFNMNNPGVLLEELSEIANVYIVHKEKLHAKVFMFYTPEGLKVFHGSANFTHGGLNGNLELIHEVNLNDLGRLGEFINHCSMASEKVSDKIIQSYKDIDRELGKLSDANREANKRINEIFIDENDPFRESDYNLDSYFLNFQDYETLFPKHQYQDGPIINKRRETVRKKLLILNNQLKNELKQHSLYNHWASKRNPELITSQIIRSEYNHKRLSWICLRYGKHKKDAIIEGSSAERYEIFIKHACMQVSVVGDGVQIGLFHATANGAIDRDYLKEGKIDTQRDKIHQEIKKLQGEKLVWHIYDPNSDKSMHKFEIDKEDPYCFVDFYKKYDKEGYESFCIYHMLPNDKHIKTKESIIQIAKEKIAKLYPLYRLMTWRITNR